MYSGANRRLPPARTRTTWMAHVPIVRLPPAVRGGRLSGLGGQATDIDIHAKEILRMRTTINSLLAKHTGQPVDRIEKDVERDYIMNAEQAKEYGMIDEIIYKHR